MLQEALSMELRPETDLGSGLTSRAYHISGRAIPPSSSSPLSLLIPHSTITCLHLKASRE